MGISLHTFSVCVVFICPILTLLIGLAQVLRPWDPKFSVRKWSSYPSTTQRNLFLLASYFSALPIATLVLSGIWLRVPSHSAFQLLLRLSWLNGLSVEAIVVSRVTYIVPFCFLTHTVLSSAGCLQVVGIGISLYHNDAGIYVAFAGSCLFHVFAAGIIPYYFLRYESVRHRKLGFLGLTFVCASGSCGFIEIRNRDVFLLANCILECGVNVILLSLARVHTASSQGGSNLSAHSYSQSDGSGAGLTTYTVLWTISTHTTTVQTTGNRDDPSPVPRLRDATNHLHSVPPPHIQGIEASQIYPLSITASENGTFAQIMALSSDGTGGLRLFNVDWRTLWNILSHEQRLQMKENIGDSAYDVSTRLSTVVLSPARQDQGAFSERIIWIEYDLAECISSPEHRKALLVGYEVRVEALAPSVAKSWGIYLDQIA